VSKVRSQVHRISKKKNKRTCRISGVGYTCLLTGGSGANCKQGKYETIVSPRQLDGRPHVLWAFGADIFSCSTLNKKSLIYVMFVSLWTVGYISRWCTCDGCLCLDLATTFKVQRPMTTSCGRRRADVDRRM